MNIQESDTHDGRHPGRQLFFWIFYPIIFWLLYKMAQVILILVTEWAFGTTTGTQVFLLYRQPIAITLLVMTATMVHQAFWLNPNGNEAIPTVNMFLPKKVRDGSSTRFIVYTAGFAWKWPWERAGKGIDLERDETSDCKSFNVTVGDTTLEFEMSLAYKPHPYYLSSFLGNIGDHKKLIAQIVAAATQITEELASKYKDSEHVRKTLSVLVKAVTNLTQLKANDFGFLLTDISFGKCDYSTTVRNIMDQKRAAKIVTDIIESLRGDGMDYEEASLTALLIVQNPNVSRNEYGITINAPTDIVELAQEIGPGVIRKFLESKASSSRKSKKPRKVA